MDDPQNQQEEKETVDKLRKAQRKMEDLSPQEREAVLRKRKTFSDLHSIFENVDIFTALGVLGELETLIRSAFMAQEEKQRVYELETEKYLKDRGIAVMNLLKGYTVSEATTYLRYLQNAIIQERDKKMLNTKVSELDIKLLDPEL